MLHPHSRWRDLPRVWWVERVADTMENRVHERRGGHCYQGRRRELPVRYGEDMWGHHTLCMYSPEDSVETN